MDFIDANEYEEITVKIEPKTDQGIRLKLSNKGTSSSQSANKSSESAVKKSSTQNPQQSSQAKLFCRYCDTNFANKNEYWMHLCKYLQCDPNNYICRICLKEVNKKHFDNHVHNEKFECKTCETIFYSQDDYAEHNLKNHKSDSDVPPKKRVFDYTPVADFEAVTKVERPVNCLLRRKGVRTKVKYPRKKQRFECDLCGKYLVSSRSLYFHMNLHRGDSSYMCASCGEVFFTPNGIKGKLCLNLINLCCNKNIYRTFMRKETKETRKRL